MYPPGSPYRPLGSLGSDSFIRSPRDWRDSQFARLQARGPSPNRLTARPAARSGRSAPIRSFGRLATGGIPCSLAFRRGAPAPTALRLAPRPARVARLPLQRSFDRAAPAVVATRARAGIHRRLEGPLDARARGQRIQRAPEASSDASQIRRTQPRRLRHRGPDHGDIEDIRLKLAEEVVGGGTAI